MGQSSFSVYTVNMSWWIKGWTTRRHYSLIINAATRVQQHITPVASLLHLQSWRTAPSRGSLLHHTTGTLNTSSSCTFVTGRKRCSLPQTERAAMFSGCRLHEVEDANEQCIMGQKGSWALRASLSRCCSSDRESTWRQMNKQKFTLLRAILHILI